MKKYIICVLLGSIFIINHAFSATPPTKQIKLICEFSNCPPTDSLFIFRFEGLGFVKEQGVIANDKGQFEFELLADKFRFYYVGNGKRQVKPFLVGNEDTKVFVRGNCQNIRNAVADSDINRDYLSLKTEIRRLKQEDSKLGRRFSTTKDVEERKAIVKEMKTIDVQKLALLDSLKKDNPFLAKIAAVNTYLSFHNNGGKYPNEIDYFVNESFRFADFTDSDYVNNPWVYEAFKGYAQTLAKIRQLNSEQNKKTIDHALSKVPQNTNMYKLALSGVVLGLQTEKHPNYAVYASQIIEKYEKEHPLLVANMKREVEKVKRFMKGSVAPDFTELTPTGDSLSLSDLKGKVVLVDFWASWCGPCRRENPHVVAMYNKYKDKGFEILGVSLDKTKDRWVKAIEADGLVWQHVSDLRGWSSAIGRMYGVSSIPHTVLLDQEGRIVASKLRGKALERKVAELLENTK